MKKLCLGSVAVVALGLGTSAALAAELRRPPPPPPPAPAYAPAPAYTWSGCYIGASAGTSSGRSDGFSTSAGTLALGVGPAPGAVVAGGFPITDSFDLTGFIGGGQIGCNWQWGAWVFGIEGDGSATNKEGQSFGNGATTPTSIGPLATNPATIYELQERWLVTARGKLGLTNFWWFGPNTLVYVTGGGAWAKIDASQWLAGFPTITGLQQSDTRSGWTVGGGYEYALGYGWSAKGEFLYVDFGNWDTFNCASVGPGCPRGAATNLNVNLKDYIFRAGLNYRFW
jgi:outer membrane immunogenic protein